MSDPGPRVALVTGASRGFGYATALALGARGDQVIALARTVEYFRVPHNVITLCVGKSTYARCGIIVNVTPFEPAWEGHVTLEISNTTPLPAKI